MARRVNGLRGAMRLPNLIDPSYALLLASSESFHIIQHHTSSLLPNKVKMEVMRNTRGGESIERFRVPPDVAIQSEIGVQASHSARIEEVTLGEEEVGSLDRRRA